MACAPREFRLISRYTREEMGRVWSEEGKFRRWLEVELAATETLAETGVVPAAAAAKIREKARVDAGVVKRIAEHEAKVKHDVIAFTMAVGETIADPDAARWLHYGLTSNDVVDTAQALQIREASRLIEHGLVRFGEVLERRAREFQHVPQIGRTHGVHAEPTTFGLKVANWFAENRRNLERFGQAARQMAVGKISGAVGNASHLGPDVEEAICRRLGLEVAPVASQVIQRDRHAQYPRPWQFSRPRLKKSPWKSAICSAPRSAKPKNLSAPSSAAVRPCRTNAIRYPANRSAASPASCAPNAGAAFENIALWHERDISHSSVERVILPFDSTILADYLLTRMTDIVSGMRVFPERMRRNLDATGGLVFSGQLPWT